MVVYLGIGWRTADYNGLAGIEVIAALNFYMRKNFSVDWETLCRYTLSLRQRSQIKTMEPDEDYPMILMT